MSDFLLFRIGAGLLRSVTLRCPHCRRGRVLRNPYVAHERCAACGLRFLRDEGDFWGTVVIAYAVGSIAGLGAVGLLLAREVESLLLVATVGALTAAAAILLVFPFAKSFWIALLFHTRGHFEEYRPPSDWPQS